MNHSQLPANHCSTEKRGSCEPFLLLQPPDIQQTAAHHETPSLQLGHFAQTEATLSCLQMPWHQKKAHAVTSRFLKGHHWATGLLTHI